MNYSYGLLPESWLWTSTVLYTIAMLTAIVTTRWRDYLEQPEKAHVLLGSTVALILMWKITTTHLPGLEYHYLGATLMTLMFGWQRALLVISLVLLGLIYNGDSDWQTYPINVLVMGLVPILTSYGVYRLVDRKLPNHVFVYIFLNGFFGAALAMATAETVAALLLIVGNVYTFDQLSYDFFPFLPLMMFPEAFITGMFTSILVAMYPGWITTFDDARYLKSK
jgi:uncharacterized membrane protein